MRECYVQAPCKINLGLNVVGVRPDGYHLLEMVMQAVSLQDTLRLSLEGAGGIRLDCGLPGLPNDGRNLAYRAAELFFRHTGRAAGLTIQVTKRIPMQAGLAGGSADAAGVLAGLNVLLDTGLPLEELCQLGASLGADVPFCLTGGAALVEGIGERITPLPPLQTGWILLVKPRQGVDTAASFRRYDHLTWTPPGASTPLLREGMEQGNLALVARGLGNQLEAVCQLPDIPRYKERLLELEAVGSLMSGSGSAVFGLFPQEAQAARAFDLLQAQGEQVYLCRPLPHGPLVLPTPPVGL